VRDKAVVEVYHAGKLLQALDGGGARELGDGFDLGREGNGAVAGDTVAQKVDGLDAELALVQVEEEAMVGQAGEQGTKVSLVVPLAGAGY